MVIEIFGLPLNVDAEMRAMNTDNSTLIDYEQFKNLMIPQVEQEPSGGVFNNKGKTCYGCFLVALR
jgi:hypothetical protein